MGRNERILWTLRCLGVLACFVIGPFAQAATFIVNTPFDAAGAAPLNDGICATAYNNGVPNGVCTLRAAIQEANALGGINQIILPSLPTPNAYVLTIITELTSTSNLTITGGGAATTIINGNRGLRPDSRVLHIANGTVNISGITIRNGGKTSGNDGGGGIFNEGTLTLTNTTVTENSFNPPLPGFLFTPFFDGGGITNFGTMTLINSTVSLNSVTMPSPLMNRPSEPEGGGIENAGIMTLINSTVSGNSLNGVAGEFDGTSGGGINNDGTLTLINSTVSGNSANSGSQFDSGGGIFNNGTLALTNSTVSGNSAGVDGGGIYNNSATMTLTNSTVSGNSAGQSGGGLYNITRLVTPAVANLFNTTITNNQADADFNGSGTGGGVFNASTFNFENTIIAGNFETLAVPIGFGVFLHIPIPGDCTGIINSGGNNLMLAPNCTVNGEAPTVADPLLGPLQNNGGPTQTHALLAGSPAIDAGQQGGCRDQFTLVLSRDQRGFRRRVDGNGDGVSRCDIGAYEFSSGAVTTSDFDGDVKSDIAIYRNGAWSIFRSLDGGNTVTGWGGAPQDAPVPADYDGDGKTDIAIYRDGAWSILRSSDGVNTVTGWGGAPQDVLVPADYDGDGKTDIAIYRDGAWSIKRSSDGGNTVVGWGGAPQDILVPADYDGDGKTDIAIYRDGTWSIRRSTDGGNSIIGWGGAAQDIPVPADYDGDGKADIAIYRDGVWSIRESTAKFPTVIAWGGSPGDIPVPADYDGDGKADIAIYRASIGQWIIKRSSDGGTTVINWGGAPQDIPLN